LPLIDWFSRASKAMCTCRRVLWLACALDGGARQQCRGDASSKGPVLPLVDVIAMLCQCNTPGRMLSSVDEDHKVSLRIVVMPSCACDVWA
jgi:hypothetical protein